MKNTQHLGFWFLVAVAGFFAGPMLRSGQSSERYLAAEIEETRQAMGDTVGALVLSFADAAFHGTPVAPLASAVASARHTEAEQRLSARIAGPGGEIMSRMYNSYLQGLPEPEERGLDLITDRRGHIVAKRRAVLRSPLRMRIRERFQERPRFKGFRGEILDLLDHFQDAGTDRDLARLQSPPEIRHPHCVSIPRRICSSS